ncbi:MAG: exopolysaccharide biosynthesis polyprenyl glycosylphosphotransferase [Elusimicrobia bacterium]|nr:exopolysaccharide biosynthesis polyprenyl glycosylphosphotransferase [Elusimicrobiota bacterium]
MANLDTQKVTYSGLEYKILLLVGDVLLLYTSLWISLVLRYPGQVDLIVFLEHAQPFTAVYLLWLVLLYLSSLYNLTRIRDWANIYFDLTRALLLGTIAGIVIFYILPYSDLTPKRLLVMDAAIFGLLIAIWRAWFIRMFGKYLPINRVAIIGVNLRSLELGRELLKRPRSGYQLAALVGDSQQQVSTPPGLENVQVIQNPYNLLQHIREDNINTLVIASTTLNQALLNRLFEYLPLRIRFYEMADFYEELTDKIPVAQLEHAWFLNNIDETNKQSYDLAKRLIDIVIALTLLVVSFPLMAVSTLLIVLDSKGPIVYAQKRVGHKNKIFNIYKLRTMIQDAELAGAQWSQKNDPRITRVGKWLRRSRLDEIPQLMNILRGDMSLTGPRPERPEFVNDLVSKVPFYKTRHLIKPGWSGWAQVKFPYGASVQDAFEKLQYDLYYIKHRSFSLDLSIWIRTVIVVLGFRGR